MFITHFHLNIDKINHYPSSCKSASSPSQSYSPSIIVSILLTIVVILTFLIVIYILIVVLPHRLNLIPYHLNLNILNRVLYLYSPPSSSSQSYSQSHHLNRHINLNNHQPSFIIVLILIIIHIVLILIITILTVIIHHRPNHNHHYLLNLNRRPFQSYLSNLNNLNIDNHHTLNSYHQRPRQTHNNQSYTTIKHQSVSLQTVTATRYCNSYVILTLRPSAHDRATTMAYDTPLTVCV